MAAGVALAAFASASVTSSAQEHKCFVGGGTNPCTVHNFAPKPKKNADTFWIDTDGENPALAGCHIEVVSMTNANPLPNGRVFGEVCEPGNKVLIETNPEANKVHKHGNDFGAPYRIDCAKWCALKHKTKKGACKPTTVRLSYKNKPISCRSAQCVCSN